MSELFENKWFLWAVKILLYVLLLRMIGWWTIPIFLFHWIINAIIIAKRNSNKNND